MEVHGRGVTGAGGIESQPPPEGPKGGGGVFSKLAKKIGSAFSRTHNVEQRGEPIVHRPSSGKVDASLRGQAPGNVGHPKPAQQDSVTEVFHKLNNLSSASGFVKLTKSETKNFTPEQKLELYNKLYQLTNDKDEGIATQRAIVEKNTTRDQDGTETVHPDYLPLKNEVDKHDQIKELLKGELQGLLCDSYREPINHVYSMIVNTAQFQTPENTLDFVKVELGGLSDNQKKDLKDKLGSSTDGNLRSMGLGAKLAKMIN